MFQCELYIIIVFLGGIVDERDSPLYSYNNGNKYLCDSIGKDRRAYSAAIKRSLLNESPLNPLVNECKMYSVVPWSICRKVG